MISSWYGLVLKNYFKINSCHPTIKFHFEIYHKEITLFDTTVFIDFDEKLKAKLYRKPTDWQSYLHTKSEHPLSRKKSIPKSQAIRIRKICHDEQDFINNCKTLMDTFQKRRYEKDFVESQVEKTKNFWRKELLTVKSKEPFKRILSSQKLKS